MAKGRHRPQRQYNRIVFNSNLEPSYYGGSSTPLLQRTIDFMSETTVPNNTTIYYSGTKMQKTGSQLWRCADVLVQNLMGIGPRNSTTNFWDNKGMVFFHPEIGGDDDSHAINLINPTGPTITWGPGWTHSGRGAKPNGIDSYADTGFSPSVMSSANFSFGRYNGTSGVDGGSNVDMGVSNAGNTNIQGCFTNYSAGGNGYFTVKDYTPTLAGTNGMRFQATNRKSSTITQGFIDGLLIASGTEAGVILEAGNFYYGALNKGGTPDFFSAKGLRAGWMMEGLTESEMLLFYQIVEDFQVSLGRPAAKAYAYGDSITLGFGATDSYAQLLAHKFAWNLTNEGINGATLISATPTDVIAGPNMYDNRTSIPVYSSSLDAALVIAFGVNDCGLNYPNYTTALYGTQLAAIIDYATGTKGWPASKIIIQCATYVTSANWQDYVDSYGSPLLADTTRFLAFQAAAQSVAATKGATFLNPYSYMQSNGGVILLVDGRHPNDAGHILIADYDYSQISSLF